MITRALLCAAATGALIPASAIVPASALADSATLTLANPAPAVLGQPLTINASGIDSPPPTDEDSLFTLTAIDTDKDSGCQASEQAQVQKAQELGTVLDQYETEPTDPTTGAWALGSKLVPVAPARSPSAPTRTTSSTSPIRSPSRN